MHDCRASSARVRSALAQPSAEEPAAAEHGGGTAHDLGHGNARAGLDSMTEVRTDLAIYTLAVFLTLVTLLGIFVWPKISKALLEREKRIEDSLAAADAKHEEAKRLLAEHEARLAGAAGEVRALLGGSPPGRRGDQDADRRRSAARRPTRSATGRCETSTSPPTPP